MGHYAHREYALFPLLSGGNRYFYRTCVEVGIVSFNPFGCLLHWSQVISLHRVLVRICRRLGGCSADCWSPLPDQLPALHWALYSTTPQRKGGDSVSPSSLLPLTNSGDHQSPSFCLLPLWPGDFLAETWDNPRACVIGFLFLMDCYPSLSNVQCLENYGFIYFAFFFLVVSHRRVNLIPDTSFEVEVIQTF